MKYVLKVVKVEEVTKNDFDRGLMYKIPNDHIIFEADMTSDSTIEILQHLYDLSSRKLVE